MPNANCGAVMVSASSCCLPVRAQRQRAAGQSRGGMLRDFRARRRPGAKFEDAACSNPGAGDVLDVTFSGGQHVTVRECDTFYRCAVDKLTYPEVIEHYTFNKGKWAPRVCRSTTLGRMHVCTPAAGERFYLRLLLARVKGPVSFSALRCTADGTVHGSFQAACVARNLVADDHEWAGAAADLCRHVMNQGALHMALCTLFANCRLNDPATVLQDNLGALVCTWQRDDQQLCPPVVMPAEAYWQRLLRAFDSALRQTGSCNVDVGLPAPEPDCVLGGAEAHTLGGKVYADPAAALLLRQEQLVEEAMLRGTDATAFSAEQRTIADTVETALLVGSGGAIFILAAAGTGKTTVLKTCINNARAKGHIVLATAASAIAAQLLPGGTTFHRALNCPVSINEGDSLAFSVESDNAHARALRQTSMIVVDEGPMLHRFCWEAMDLSLRDLMQVNRPFGGILVVGSGDFRQIGKCV